LSRQYLSAMLKPTPTCKDLSDSAPRVNRRADGVLGPGSALAAENLFLRKQVALYLERKKRPRRATDAVRFTMALLARFFEWRQALTNVKPDTQIRSHRKGLRQCWKLKSSPRASSDSPRASTTYGQYGSQQCLMCEERIASELLLKIGIEISPRTVAAIDA
jgi:putative transposase